MLALEPHGSKASENPPSWEAILDPLDRMTSRMNSQLFWMDKDCDNVWCEWQIALVLPHTFMLRMDKRQRDKAIFTWKRLYLARDLPLISIRIR
jgi:hypothetical protein